MTSVVYEFVQGGHRRRLLFERVLPAVHKAVHDLHNGDAEADTISWGARLLYDRAALERIWAACQAELLADPWHVPTALEPTARREVRRG
jgi:hypothetical protein